MKYLLFAALLSLASASDFRISSRSLEVPQHPDKWVFLGEKNNTDRRGRVSSGQTAGDTQFPWIAQLSINTANGGYRCTGSLIKSNWIVSARHCVADLGAYSIQANLGSADSQAFRVTAFANLYAYLTANTGSHPDISLFQMSSNIPLSNYVNVVRLPSRAQEFSNFEGQTITAAGWGGDGSGGFPRFLQWTTFRVLYRSECNFGWASYVMCSQPPAGVASLEGGDSGGPSVIYENGIPTLVGINVFYAQSGTTRWQGSTGVSSFYNFITSYTGLVIRN